MLKAVLQSLEGLDEATAKLYTKGDDGRYTLSVDGLVPSGKLDEFRTNNVELKKQLDEMKAQLEKFSGVDLKKYQEAMAAIENDAEKKLVKEGKFDEVIQLRTEKMRQSYEEQIKAKDQAIQAAQKEREAAIQTQNNYIVQSELTRVTSDPELGFQENIAGLLTEQVLKEFRVKDGKVIRVNPADGSPVFGANGDPATITEFLHEVVKTRPYLVRGSNGAGARNSSNQAPNGKVMTRKQFDSIADPVQKAKLMKEGVQLVDK